MDEGESQASQRAPLAIDPEAVQQASAALRDARYTGTSGEGRVQATVAGTMELLELDIDPLLERHHRAALARWIQEAVGLAREDAGKGAQETMGDVLPDTEELVAAARAAVPWLSGISTEEGRRGSERS